MKQVLQTRKGMTVVRDVPVPPCPRGGLLVRNAFSAISAGTERTVVGDSQKSLVSRARERPDLVRKVLSSARAEGIRGTWQGVQRRLAEETALGYSSAGTVVEVGAAVTELAPGDLVACAGAGHANHAEIVAVPRNLCARVPDGVVLSTASLTTIAAIALHGVRLADVRLGESAAVVGCGLVGQITCRLLRAAGAEVFALDLDPGRVAQALDAGADHGIDPGADAAAAVESLTAGVGVDHAIVTAAAGTPDPLLLGAAVARDRGSLTLVGAVPIELPREPLFAKELAFRVSRSYGPGRYDADYEEHGVDYPIAYVRWTEQRNMEAVLALQARGRLNLDDLVEVVPVDEAEQAYERIVGPAEERPRGALVIAYPELDVEERLSTTVPAAEGARAWAGDSAPAIGLLGPGSFATQVLVPAFAAAGARLELVGGGSGPSAAAAQRDGSFARVAETAKQVLTDPAVDAVVIATRHDTHADYAAAGLRAGKHVFTEKPLALSVEELDEVLRAADGAPGILAVGFNRRFSPLLVELHEFLSARPGDGRVTALYRVSAGAIEAGHWVHDLDQGGGRLIGEVCHFVDSLAFLVGSEVVEVHAAGHGMDGGPTQARDNLVVSLTFTDGSVGSVVYVAAAAAGMGKERLEAFAAGRIAVLDDYRALELHADGRETERRLKAPDKGHQAEARAFVEGMRTGEPPVPLTEVANVSLATLAAVESLRTGRPVRVG